MTQTTPPSGLAKAWERYRHNPIRHLSAITRHAEIETMTRLEHRGYRQLSMGYSGPMTLLGIRPQRLTELAQTLRISKQLCLQTLRQLERAGLIERSEDPHDRRAKRVQLSAKGRRLVTEAVEDLAAIQAEYGTLIGAGELAGLEKGLLSCAGHLEPTGVAALENPGGNAASITALIGAVTRQLHQRLMELTASYGHPDLQMSFSQVLTNVDLHGTSVSAIAAQNGVTPQAISRIARELESLGYIQRRASPADGRARILFFTPHGLTLLADSVRAMDTIEGELKTALGERDWQGMTRAARSLYEGLGAESGLVGGYDEAAARALYAGVPQAAATTTPHLLELLLYVVSTNGAAQDAITTDRHGNIRLSRALIERLESASFTPKEVEKALRKRFDPALLRELREQLS